MTYEFQITVETRKDQTEEDAEIQLYEICTLAEKLGFNASFKKISEY